MPNLNDFGPAVDARDAVALRNALVQRTIYGIADSENPADFVANTSGTVSLGLAYRGNVFWLDPNDTTSAHDAVTVIVTDDGYRYLVSDFKMPRSVIASNQTAPPGSPSIGDAYLTSAAPTGAWAGHGEQVAVYTSRGWVFVAPQVGELIYVADGTARWMYLNEGGAMVERFGQQPASIPDGALIGGQRRFIVENMTTNTPPGSPALGQYWIVGNSPTGAWAGQTGNIATNYGSGWVFIAASNGLEAYLKNTTASVTYDGSAWVSSSGAWLRFASAITAGTGSTTAPTGGTYWNGTATPTTNDRRIIDTVTLSFAASASSRLLRFKYRADITGFSANTGSTQMYLACALFRDSEVNAVAWGYLQQSTQRVLHDTVPTTIDMIPSRAEGEFLLPAGNTNSRTYRVAIMSRATNVDVTQLARRTFSVEEAF